MCIRDRTKLISVFIYSVLGRPWYNRWDVRVFSHILPESKPQHVRFKGGASMEEMGRQICQVITTINLYFVLVNQRRSLHVAGKVVHGFRLSNSIIQFFQSFLDTVIYREHYMNSRRVFDSISPRWACKEYVGYRLSWTPEGKFHISLQPCIFLLYKHLTNKKS